MDRLPADEMVAATALSTPLANHPDYEIVRKLGGGTGVVYLARNRLMGRCEVLRIIGPDIIARTGVRDHFLREIRSVAKLRHPNIVTAYSGFRWDESLVFAMEYAEGLDLARLVKASGPLPVAHACSFVFQAALGLQHAHRARLVHRDIKPGNLMLTHKGSRAIVKVLDFGVAKAGREQGALSVFALDVLDRESATTNDPTAASQMLSTPDYIAPEQIADAHAADIRADIYSLGCTLYFLLSGRPPFQGATAYDVLQAQHSMNALPLNKARRDVPAELAALVAKAMAKDRDERFQTPDELANALALPFFKNRRMGGESAKLGGSSPAAMRSGGSDKPRGAQAADTNAASPGGAAGNVTAIWSNLIDLSELPDDADEGPADDRPRWPRSVGAGVAAGLAMALLLVGLTIRYKALRSSSATVRSTKTDTPPSAIAKTERPPDTMAPSGALSGETRTSAQAAQKAAIVHATAELGPESKLTPRGKPTLAPASNPTITPATVSSRDASRLVPAVRPAMALSTADDVREVASFKAPGRVRKARLLRDNQRVLYETAGSARGLWVGNSQDQNNPRKLEGRESDWVQVVLASDGRLAVALNSDRSLSVWDVETRESRRLPPGDRGGITPLALSPDSRRAVYVVGEGFHVRDLISGGVDSQRGRLESAILQIAFCPAEPSIVTAHVDRTIRSYSLENTREGPRMLNQTDVTDLAVFPDGRRVLASCSDGTVSVWDLNTGRKLREIVVAANGRFGEKSREEVVAADGVVSVAALTRRPTCVVRIWNPHGALGHGDGRGIEACESSGEGPSRRIFARRPLRGIDRRRYRPDLGIAARPKARRAALLIEIAHFFGTENQVLHALVSPDGTRILAGCWNAVQVWDRQTGQLFRRLDRIGGSALAVSRDGRHILSAGGDKEIEALEPRPGTARRRAHRAPGVYLQRGVLPQRPTRILWQWRQDYLG